MCFILYKLSTNQVQQKLSRSTKNPKLEVHPSKGRLCLTLTDNWHLSIKPELLMQICLAHI